MRNYCENINCTECFTTLMDGVIDNLLQVVIYDVVPQHLKVFIEKHRNDVNILGIVVWGEDILQCVGTELAFFIKHREHLFNAACNRYGVNSGFDKGRYWEHSSYLTSASKQKRSTNNMG